MIREDMRRLGLRAFLLFLAYVAVLAAFVVAGFLDQRLGIWASILWGCGLALAVGTYIRRRSAVRGGG
jgi:hypothetical protein